MISGDKDYCQFCDERPDVWTYISVFLAGMAFLASAISVAVLIGAQI